jgi:hypothetical protein
MTAPLPDIEHRPGEVTFRGEALKTLNGAIDAGIREKRGAGWSIEPYRRAKFAVLAAYRSQAMAVRGHQMDERAFPDRPLGDTDGARLLSTREAATEIGCSVRHARRLQLRVTVSASSIRPGCSGRTPSVHSNGTLKRGIEMEDQPTEYPAEWGYAVSHDPVGLAIDSFVASLTAAEFAALVDRTAGVPGNEHSKHSRGASAA